MPTIKIGKWTKIGKSCLLCDKIAKVYDSEEEAMLFSNMPIICDGCKQAIKELKERLKNETMA